MSSLLPQPSASVLACSTQPSRSIRPLKLSFSSNSAIIRLGPCPPANLGEARDTGGQELSFSSAGPTPESRLKIVRCRCLGRRCGLRLGLRLLEARLSSAPRSPTGRRRGPRAHGCLHARRIAARGQDLGDLHQRQLLAVALPCAASRALRRALDEVDELFALHLVDDQRLNGRRRSPAGCRPPARRRRA